jgi:hypothetical protein
MSPDTLIERDCHDRRFLEGVAGRQIIGRRDEAARLIEACFEHDVERLLLYPENLTTRFFDLSSGEAGEILQKLRNYNIRLAVVRTPTLRLSSHFDDLMVEENRMPYFRIVDDRPAAEEWLCSE